MKIYENLKKKWKSVTYFEWKGYKISWRCKDISIKKAKKQNKKHFTSKNFLSFFS